MTSDADSDAEPVEHAERRQQKAGDCRPVRRAGEVASELIAQPKKPKGDSDRNRSHPRFAQPRCINFHIVARALSAQSAGPATASSLTYPSAAAASSHTRVSPADP